jgi:hypothetical protein
VAQKHGIPLDYPDLLLFYMSRFQLFNEKPYENKPQPQWPWQETMMIKSSANQCTPPAKEVMIRLP